MIPLLSIIGGFYWLIGLCAGVAMLIGGHTLLEVFRVPLVGMSFLFTAAFGLMFIILSTAHWASVWFGGRRL